MRHSKTIIDIARQALSDNPAASEVLVTEDGNAWLPENASLAHNHAQQARIPAPVTVTREEVGLEPLASVAAAEELPAGEQQTNADAGGEEPAGEEASTTHGEAAQEGEVGTPRGVELVGDTVKLAKHKEVPGQTVVDHALVSSGLSLEQWNAQDDDTILEKCFDAIEAMKKQA